MPRAHTGACAGLGERAAGPREFLIVGEPLLSVAAWHQAGGCSRSAGGPFQLKNNQPLPEEQGNPLTHTHLLCVCVTVCVLGPIGIHVLRLQTRHRDEEAR